MYDYMVKRWKWLHNGNSGQNYTYVARLLFWVGSLKDDQMKGMSMLGLINRSRELNKDINEIPMAAYVVCTCFLWFW